MTISPNFPDLPLICLQSADELSTHELVKGKNIVIGKNREKIDVEKKSRSLMSHVPLLF